MTHGPVTAPPLGSSQGRGGQGWISMLASCGLFGHLPAWPLGQSLNRPRWTGAISPVVPTKPDPVWWPALQLGVRWQILHDTLITYRTSGTSGLTFLAPVLQDGLTNGTRLAL